MRTIEFRGRRIDNKEWVYGNYYFYTDTIYCVASDKDHEENEHHCILFDGFCDWNMPRPHYKAFVDKNTIGQFTGLYDKNGAKIFEGDILHFEYTDGQDYYKDVEEVRYNSEGCLIPFAFEYECDGCDLRYEIMSIEVIGNIHKRSGENDE